MTIQSGTHAIESMQLEERRYPPPPEFAKNANAKADIYDRAFEDFWKEEALKRVSWFKSFDQVLEWKLPYAKWFLGGKLNACYNCVDRHL
ncbi:MAG: acetyl-CoA synthetase, partial [Chloroflexota bacterium]|nr:acetyl-CoA synthetase [Chloroflexota bacterium]